MALDVGKLNKVRQMSDGRIIAQCPACAECGHDKHGKDHLVVWPDGRFACVANPGDKAHRKAIWAVAGDRNRKPVMPSVNAVKLRWTRAY